jgi:hypothetical protein
VCWPLRGGGGTQYTQQKPPQKNRKKRKSKELGRKCKNKKGKDNYDIVVGKRREGVNIL